MKQLKPVGPEDFPDLRKYFAGQTHTLSAYSLPALLVWRNEIYQPLAADVDGALVIGFEFDEANKHHRHLMLPVNPSGDVFPPERLVQIAEAFGFDTYCLIPEDYLARFEDANTFFHIEEQPGYADYVYMKEDLAELKGNKFSKKRNLINQFKKRYLNNGAVSVDKIRPEDADECADFLEKWCEERDCDEEDGLACEKAAAINILEYFGDLDVRGILLRMNGEIGAFAVASDLTSDMGVLHFEKALAKYKGLYQYFDKECAKRLFNGSKYINKESDMDIPGLAKAKKSYHPVFMVKSYKLTIR